MKLINSTEGSLIANQVEVAGSWYSRLKGLLSRDSLPENHCLILNPCNSVHTCFMKFNIDVLFVDQEGVVVYLMQNVPPFRFSPIVKTARFVIELPANTISSSAIKIHDKLNILQKMLNNC